MSLAAPARNNLHDGNRFLSQVVDLSQHFLEHPTTGREFKHLRRFAMSEVSILGITVQFRNRFSNIVAVENLTNTLTIVLPEHRAAIRRIDVVPPSNLGHGPDYAGGGSGCGYPRLSELCFDRRYRLNNFPINLTLLHEIGHILQNKFNCLAQLTPAHRATLTRVPIPESAQTHGAGEHYAIAYQQVMVGRASPAVKAAVLASKAFEGVDTTSIP